MVTWIEPKYSRNRINTAGDRIRKDQSEEEDLLVMENWRASHAYILNTFQFNLRNKPKDFDVTIAQRLKRKNTVFDKLKRNPGMKLARMHDVAGCRLIFKSEEAINNFRRVFHESRFHHVLRNGENDRYNYIENPKSSGYRGVHDVFEYKVSSERGQIWNGLLVEIQYRTVYQHAWATAVEVADLITTRRIKFSEADADHADFFILSSEIIARVFERRNSCAPELSNLELVARFQSINKKLGLLELFRRLKQSRDTTRFTKNMVLIIRDRFYDEEVDDIEEDILKIEAFDSVNRAIERYEELEREYKDEADIVLVRADAPENIREAFKNYFSDANEFVNYIDEGLKSLTNSVLLSEFF